MDGSPYGELTKPQDVSNNEISDDVELVADSIRGHGEGGILFKRSPTSLATGEFPIDHSREWDRALWAGDCMTLLERLKSNPSLLNSTTSERDTYRVSRPGIQDLDPSNIGNTVLHWAAKRRCLELLVYILSLFMDDDGKVVKKFVHDGTTIYRKGYIQQKNRAKLTAAELLWSVKDYSIYTYFSNFAKYHNFDLTLKEMQLEVLDPMYVPPISATSLTSAAILDGNVSMREIVLKATSKHKMMLGNTHPSEYDTWYDYNFVEEYEELLFHFACGHLDSKECEECVRAVIREVAKEGPEAVKYLFNSRNAQGRTPLHCACIHLQNLLIFLELLRVELGPLEEIGDCYNSRDVAGWTVLHLAASQGNKGVVKALLKEKRVDVNAEVKNKDGVRATALHLAIIHNRLRVVRLLIGCGGADVNAPLRGYFPYKGIVKFELSAFTPLYLAASMGRSAIVKALIDHTQVEDGLIEGQVEISAIHIAAMNGDPKSMRHFMNNPKFDISVIYKGCTALHFVVDGSHLGGDLLQKSIKKYCHDKKAESRGSYRRQYTYESVIDTNRKACISMMIQGGLDVWQKNDEGSSPEVGPNISYEVHQFWYEKLWTETQDAKNNLNVAGNAISVVSALVATASYVGPLQPPLGFDSNSVHDGSLPIRVYMVTNTLSFYMAVASIIFAVVPSLPMPQEGLYNEWQRSQKSIIYAIHLLLLAVISILISFGAASNVVLSLEYSWQHQGLVFYPSLLGGLISMIAITLFYLRLFRLTFVRNLTIKHIYHYVFRINQKEKVKVKDEGEVESEDDLSDLDLSKLDDDNWI